MAGHCQKTSLSTKTNKVLQIVLWECIFCAVQFHGCTAKNMLYRRKLALKPFLFKFQSHVFNRNNENYHLINTNLPFKWTIFVNKIIEALNNISSKNQVPKWSNFHFEQKSSGVNILCKNIIYTCELVISYERFNMTD